MKKKHFDTKTGLISSFILLVFSACTTAVNADLDLTITPPSNTPVQTSAIDEVVQPTKTIEPVVNFTPTPDLRLLPEDWTNWPVIPMISNRANEIAEIGREKGVNTRAFSKIGDCQIIKEAFMGLYDRQYYYLPDSEIAWQETIDNFKGNFFRDGEAFGQGLNAAAALSPFHAKPEVCPPNESPVQCELRIINPAYTFIRFERWYPDVTPPEEYEKYLRQVIDLVIDNGTVPILLTKADNIEGGHKINLIITKLAYEYDIPLFNWWKAAQSLPHRGMDPERNDGFHIDPNYGWSSQSFNGLGTLDAVWKATRGY